jgi:hypothetical protein
MLFPQGQCGASNEDIEAAPPGLSLEELCSPCVSEYDELKENLNQAPGFNLYWLLSGGRG